MRIDDIIQSEDSREELEIIAERCQEFIRESEGQPLLKNLPEDYGDFYKVKVRKRKQRKQDPKHFAEMFNKAFEDEMQDLRERSVFANGELTFKENGDTEQEAFYIFPVDGYEFMYSKEVENSSVSYKNAFNSLTEKLGTEEGENIISELLKFTYTSENLVEGINSGAEIIIYNIPYFYAIRKETVDNYQNLITNIQEIS